MCGTDASSRQKYLPTVGLIAGILLLVVHMSMLAGRADIKKGRAIILIAAEVDDLGWVEAWGLLHLCTQVRKGVLNCNHQLA